MIVKNIEIPTDKIIDFCQRWEITEFALFGSVLRDDFRADSNVDILVTFALNAHHTLFDPVDMQEELEAMFKRKVDLISVEELSIAIIIFARKPFLAWLKSFMPPRD